MTVESPQPQRVPARALLILLGVVVALALAYFLFLSGGGDDEGTALPTPTRSASGTATPTASPSPSRAPGDGAPRTDESFEGRDPFSPQFLPEPAIPTPPPGGGPSPTPTATSTTTDDGTTTIRLIDIFRQDGERMATVEVDGETFTVVEGETFNGNIRLVDLTRRCGTFLFGDERFTLCLGEEIRK